MINTTSILYTPSYNIHENGTSVTYGDDGVIVDAYNTISCSTISGLYSSTVYDTMCLDMYTGLFYSSVSYLVSNITLFGIVIVLLILVPHTRYVADVRDYEDVSVFSSTLLLHITTIIMSILTSAISASCSFYSYLPHFPSSISLPSSCSLYPYCNHHHHYTRLMII